MRIIMFLSFLQHQSYPVVVCTTMGNHAYFELCQFAKMFVAFVSGWIRLIVHLKLVCKKTLEKARNYCIHRKFSSISTSSHHILHDYCISISTAWFGNSTISGHKALQKRPSRSLSPQSWTRPEAFWMTHDTLPMHSSHCCLLAGGSGV